MDIFPIVQPELYEAENEVQPKNVNIDVLWDESGPRVENGKPVMARGIMAVISWARRCLLTRIKAFLIFSSDYGCDVENLIGKSYQQSTIEAEALRLVKEALMENEFIDAVTDIKVEMKDSTLKITCKIKTQEEEAEISV